MSFPTRFWQLLMTLLHQVQTDRARLVRVLASVVLVVALLRRVVSKGEGTNKVVVVGQGSKTVLPPKQVWKPFSAFLHEVDNEQVTKVLFSDDDVLEWTSKHHTTPPDTTYLTRRVPSHLYPIVSKLADKKVEFEQVVVPPPPPRSIWSSVLIVLLPAAYIGLLGWFMYRFMGPDASLGSSSIGDTNDSKKNKTRFIDVAGADEARQAVREVCDVLKNPEKYGKAGARLPKGLLLVGPPGSGKTMLARAMAAEAGIPFFYCAGSDFVEVFAGRGAARVRSLFQRATKAAPAVIFVDEIDALGGARHSGGFSMNNNEEREQTLNQLLSCMDGFDSDARVVVMAATNRYDSLDRALVRPGRFDRVVRVELPNEKGRADILKVHTREMDLDASVDLAKIASKSGGFSGAELAALANEAAIRAVRKDRLVVSQQDFMEALEDFAKSRKGKSSASGNNAAALTERLANLFKPQHNGNNNNDLVPLDGDDDDNEDETEELD